MHLIEINVIVGSDVVMILFLGLEHPCQEFCLKHLGFMVSQSFSQERRILL